MKDLNKMKELGIRWYVVHTYSGYENKVKTNLEQIVKNRGLEKLIQEVFIPMETTVEQHGDEEKAVESKLLPAYVFVKMEMNDEMWHVVRNITGVTGFVGPGSVPVPLTDEEVKNLIGEEHVVVAETFKVGDIVSIIGGEFAQFNYFGTVIDVSENGEDVTVTVSSLGRTMSITVSATDIKKAGV